MLEKGPLFRIKSGNPDKRLFCGGNVERAQVITMEKIFTIFVWLGFGCMFALITLLYEILYKKPEAPGRKLMDKGEIECAKNMLEKLRVNFNENLDMVTSIENLLQALNK